MLKSREESFINDILCREERFNQRRVWEPFLRSAPTSDVHANLNPDEERKRTLEASVGRTNEFQFRLV